MRVRAWRLTSRVRIDLPVLLERRAAATKDRGDGGNISHEDEGKADSDAYSHVCDACTARAKFVRTLTICNASKATWLCAAKDSRHP